MNYPYPSYSWSINHHIKPATDSRTMYELLQAAYIFGKDGDYQNKITQYMIDEGYLTANVRKDAGKPQLWRDYQQILPEIGLIVSTRFTRGISITPMGLMWLDGLIGHSELITTQALKIQYPNGHKQTISTTQKEILQAQNISIPPTRVELDSVMGVSIKPAVLILRILTELQTITPNQAYITVDECAECLIPAKQNTDWPVCVSALQQVRQSSVKKADSRRKRDVQEWYRLLNLTDLFEIVSVQRSQAIRLSHIAIQNIPQLQELCDYHEDTSTFWYPTTTDKTDLALSWFKHFGSPTIESEWIVPIEEQDDEYVVQNYPEGLIEVDDTTTVDKEPSLNPQPYSRTTNESETESEPKSYKVDASKIVAGRQRQANRTRLHEEIVSILARRLHSSGYDVYEDRRSVDLLAVKADEQAILEVKTVNNRNMTRMLRLGVGQLSEYRYRHNYQTGIRPKGILVISSKRTFPDWMLDYFENDIQLGLLSVGSETEITAYTNGSIENQIAI